MAHPFDELARELAKTEGISRRTLLLRFVGGLAGTLCASLGIRAARADSPPIGSAAIGLFCLRCCEDVLGLQRPRNFAPLLTPFGRCVIACLHNPPAICHTRVCPSRTTSRIAVCAAGSACCNGECRDLRTDPQNCGGCGKVCPEPGDVCVGRGLCCPSDLPVLCGSFCAELGTHCCGGFLPLCPSGQKCCHGTCIPTSFTCCSDGSSCPPTFPFCRSGLCCATRFGDDCITPGRIKPRPAA
jgi:hypothetical protein